MKVYEPASPLMTIDEIENNDLLSYKIIIEVARNEALKLYNASPATYSLGLEKCMEAILEMLNNGEAKLIWSEDPDGDIGEDMLFVGYFNSATGKYKVPGLEYEDEDEYEDEYEYKEDEE